VSPTKPERHKSMNKPSRQASVPVLLLTACIATMLVACSGDSPEPSPQPTLALPSPVAQATVAATVIAILDGVTIEVEIGDEVFRVRYLGIDVPGGDPTITARALEFNRFRVQGRIVEIERDGTNTDDAGRLLRYVYVDGEMVNLALLEGGHAVVAGFPAGFRYRDSFLQSEAAARNDGQGYWRDVDEQNFTQEDLEEDPEGEVSVPTPSEVPQFTGGTLPLPPGAGGGSCDFTGTKEPIIKGNVDSATGKRTYIMPGSIFYSTTVVNSDEGEEWLCTEDDAIAAGWIKANH